jgi:hypothetical protein
MMPPPSGGAAGLFMVPSVPPSPAPCWITCPNWSVGPIVGRVFTGGVVPVMLLITSPPIETWPAVDP